MKFFTLPNMKSDEAKDLQQKYRNVFMSADGIEVLTDLMIRLHVLDEKVDDDEVVLSNFGHHILALMGVYQGWNAQRIIQAFLRFPVRDPQEKE